VEQWKRDPAVRIELLSPRHSKARSGFCCGNKSLDDYLRKRVSQDARRKIAVPYVLVDAGSDGIIGYYTLSATAIRVDDFPYEIRKKLPRYRTLPTTLIGRLAVDKKYQGQGWGRVLLLDALQRSLESTVRIASTAVVVDEGLLFPV